MFFKAAVLVIAVSALMSPRAAEAATRYVAPDGVGVARPCSEAAPCSLGAAIFHAADGDRIEIAGGRYEIAQALDVSDRRLEIVARSAADRPVLVSTVGGGSVALALGAGSLLRDIDIVHRGQGGFALAAEGTVERVRMTLDAPFARGIRLGRDITVRDTVVFGTGHAQQDALVAYAQSAGGAITARLRNLTVVADGDGGVALEARAFPGRRIDIDVRATLLRGTGEDAVIYGAENTPAVMRAADSNLRGGVVRGLPASYEDLGGMRDAEPVFADRAVGDLRPGAGSPTIDAGSADEHSGTRDVAGLPRTQGGVTDVGADERIVAPPVRLLGAPEADTDAITAAGEIVPGPWRLTSRWRLEVLEGDRLAAVGPWTLALFSERQRRTFRGLAPDRDYLVRVVATGAFGESADEVAVRTLPLPGAGPVPSGAVIPQPADTGAPAAPGTAPVPGTTSDGGTPTTTTREPRPVASRDRTAPTVRLAWRGRGVRLTLSESARVTLRLRAGGGRMLRTRTLRLRRGTTTVRVPRVTRAVRSVRVTAVDAAGNRTVRTFARRR
jgi:hypothetical protein